VSVGLAVFNVVLLVNSLTMGPVWFDDYSLSGLQWGAKQLFGAVETYQQEHPEARFYITPTWANGTDILKRFFFSDDHSGVELGSVNTFLNEYTEISPDLIVVMTPSELETAQKSGKFKEITPLQTIDYPNGEPGFYFTHLTYVDNVQQVFAEEIAKRYEFQSEEVTVAGTPATVKYYPLDMGSIPDLFDGKLDTVIRGAAANPYLVEIDFHQPVKARGVKLQIGGEPTEVTVSVWAVGAQAARDFIGKADQNPTPRSIEIDFGGELTLSRLTLKVFSVESAEPAHVHIWEAALLQ